MSASASFRVVAVCANADATAHIPTTRAVANRFIDTPPADRRGNLPLIVVDVNHGLPKGRYSSERELIAWHWS